MRTRRFILAAALLASVEASSLLAASAPPSAFRTSKPESLSGVGFSFCGGKLQVDLDKFGDDSGVFTVFGWSYGFYNAHALALRVDGNRIYSTNQSSPTRLVLSSITANTLTKTAQIVHLAPGAARVTTTLRATDSGGCCGLEVVTTVQNTGPLPSRFEWRWFHDTAYKNVVTCPAQSDPDVDGGEVCLPGQTHGVDCETAELDALAAGAVGCGKFMRFHSADTGLAGPTFVVDDRLNRPIDVEVLKWEDLATRPDRQWRGFVTGESFTGCLGDNSLLMTWNVPESGQPLLPGGTGSLTFWIGDGCVRDCCALAADPGPNYSICAGENITLGGAPVALGGVAPFTYTWTPDDGSLSCTDKENPIASPMTTTTYRVTVEDGNRCSASSEVSVEVRPDLIPPALGNTLRAIRDGSDAFLSWVAIFEAESYAVTRSSVRTFANPIDERVDLPGTALRVTPPALPLTLYRAHAGSCTGRYGP